MKGLVSSVRGGRSLAACLLCCGVGLAAFSPAAFGESTPLSGEPGASPLGGPLLSPSGLASSQEVAAAEQARLASPEAVRAREESTTKFAGLTPGQAATIDAETFPGIIKEPGGGPPELPAGEKITGFLTDTAAEVELGEGQHSVIESVAPMAVEASAGNRVPVNLALHDGGNGFEPTTPATALFIPQHLNDGIALTATGVSLTPVDQSGQLLRGSDGAADGMTVLYANTATDMDTVIKPTADGFDAVSVLRAADSPQELFFKVGLPQGAELQQSPSGVAQVVQYGAVIATILPPHAQDAAGTAVPVSMVVSGSTLALKVDLHSGEYQYPVGVDPEVLGSDTQLATNGLKKSNWEFFTSNGANFASKMSTESGEYLETYGIHEYKEGEWAYWGYQTQGVSKIYEFNGETEAKNKEDRIESRIELQAVGGTTEEKELLSTELSNPEYAKRPLPEPLCPKGKGTCVSTSGTAKNAVHFEQSIVNKPTSKFGFSDFLDKGEVYISEPTGTHSTTSYNTTASELEIEVEKEGKKEKQKRTNALFGAGSWLSEFGGALQFIAKDTGIGVSSARLEYEAPGGKWERLTEHNYLEENKCKGIQCYNPEHTENWTLNTQLPNGEDKIRYRAEEALGDATHETESTETEGIATVKVDYAKPRNIFLAGLPYGNELSEKSYELTAYATDGEGTTVASSGVRSITLYVDGKSIKPLSETEGKCSVAKGACTASAKYKIQGAELGAGHHAIVIEAKDNAGNEGREEETISIRHSTPVSLGPGSVDLQSGDFTLGSGDVSLGSGLAVSRVYSSRAVTAGAEGSLGPQWTLSLGTEETLVELVDGSVLVRSATGGQTIFAAVLNSEGKPTGKYEAPPGDSNLTMTLEENEKKEKVAYYLKAAAAGTSTKFTLPSSTSKVWVPTKQEGPVATDTVIYTYQTVEVAGKKITRPTEALAAHPSVSCSPKMEPGCRSLRFTYATTTTAKGENASEWGEYEGRLTKVSYEGYNPATKKMTEPAVPVAEYSYDKSGRLRAEWDPRISPALKTEYGYDTEGHVTALTPAGQESWVFTYAAIAEDAGTGRLLKAARAPVSAGLWNGKAPVNTGAPKLEGTLLYGARIGVSTGSWSNSPVAYSYKWEDCNSAGKECTPIIGATNPNYTLTAPDAGHTIVAQVSAINGGGSVTAASAASAEVKMAETEYSLPEGSRPREIVTGPDGNVWFTEEAGGKIGKITPSGTITEYKLGGIFGKAEGITVGPDKNIWFANATEYEASKIGKITTSGAITEYALSSEPSKRKPYGITAGPDGNLWFTVGPGGGPKAIGKITTSGTITEYPLSWEGPPYAITAGPDGNLWFGEGGVSEDRIAKITPSGTITEYSGVNGGTLGIITGPDKNLWSAYGDLIGKTTTSGVFTRYWLPNIYGEGSTRGIVEGPASNMWFTVNGQGSSGKKERLGTITTSGAMTEALLPAGSEPWGVATGSDKNLWFVELGAHKIGKVNLASPSQGESLPAQPGWTMEYGVPLSGTGAPHEMGLNPETHKPEPERWGQKDDPVEATAIVPPDSPQGWPATSYTRATAYYLDASGRLVNTAAPSTGTYGAISTTEYNETNDVVRTLSPDNRATALEAGTKSAEVAKLLSTEKTYNGEGAKENEVAEPGTKLIDVVGPQHMIKYIAGKEHKEALARNHEKFFYEDEAAEAETKEKYDLVTRSTDLAQLANEEEVDVRHTTTSYSGQKGVGVPAGLGWKLRQPTSVTVDPEGAKITHTMLYYEEGNEAMGQVMETRGPAGSSGNSAHDTKTIYYGAATNAEYATCGKHPEWAGLICETLPAKQPETTGAPNLPITTTTYNMWNEPETVVETFPKSVTFGEKTRTTKNTYDAAGRLASGEETSTATSETADKALPKVTAEYNSATGALEKQNTTVGEITKTITTKYNSLGQLEKYTDADGNVTTIKSGGPESDGLPEEVSDSSQGKSSQKYIYDATTKRLTQLVDSSAGTFTASYDTEGKLASEVYPNGMCANYTNNSVGEPTHVEYLKTSNCSEKEPQVWFSETAVASIRGEAMSRTSTLAKEEYTYDVLGRLTEAQETPAGEFCKTRSYVYDEESNRTGLTTREPNSKKECATEGGTVEKHTYDEANRLTDTGIVYDPLGNVTTLPAGDAEGHALESSFYVDNAIATQTQNGVTNNYYLDPAGRIRETVTGSKKAITHYDGSGESVAWTGEGSGETEKWTRNIPGIDGTLTAIQKGEGKTSETAVLQLHDLEGNIVATVKDKTGETELMSKYNSTEFGVPNAGKTPPKYAWLGAGGVSSELSSGVVIEGATSYVPQTGRQLQGAQVAPPGLPEGSGAGAAVTFQEESWNMQGAARVGAESPGLEAEREKEAAEAACRANIAACPGAEDPTHNVVLFTPVEAKEYGDVLCGCTVAHGVGNVIEMIAKKIGVAGVGDVVEEVLTGGLAESFGKELKSCGEYLSSNRANRCALEYHSWSIFGKDTWLPTLSPISIGACFFYKKSRHGEKRGLHCKNGQYYKPNSY
jgi:streptogramin lyase